MIDPVAARSQLAPDGRLRAAINLGNPVLAQAASGDEPPSGISVDIARRLAEELGVALDLVVFTSARDVFYARLHDRWDIAFLANEPARAVHLSFTSPYMQIEGVYIVPWASTIREPIDVDRAGARICVVRGSAYDLYLTRTLKQAHLERFDSKDAALQRFLTGNCEALAGIRQAMMPIIETKSGLRLIEKPFMTIRQAVAIRHRAGPGLRYLQSFIGRMRTSGILADFRPGRTWARSARPRWP